MPFQDDVLRTVLLAVRTPAGELVYWSSLGTASGETVDVRSNFAPGYYTVTATCEDLSARATLPVAGKSEGPTPIRLRLE